MKSESLWSRYVLLPRESQQAAAHDSWCCFTGMHRAVASWMLARAPASLAQDLHRHEPLHFFLFMHGLALRNVDLLIMYDWGVICPPCC